MKMKTHDITGHGAGQTWRSALRDIAICSAVLCLMTACSREEALSDPAAAGMYDGPLTIRADIEGLLETRATHKEGNLQDNETWVLSSEGHNYQEFFKADFSKGYGEFKDRDDSIVEINWSRLTPMAWGDYIIGLDNGPIGWKPDGGLNICYIAAKGSSFVNLAYEGMIDKYKAQVEPEDDTMAPNDFISGRYQENRSTALNKRWITIQLRHRMSRVHVEITSNVIENLDTRKDVKVWLSPLAEKCYGIERIYGNESIHGQNHPGVLIDSLEMLPSGEWVLDSVKSGDKVFTSSLYLLGSAEKGEPLLSVEGKEGTYRTYYLIMPPQTTHVGATENSALRPTLHIKFGEQEYAGMLPGNIKVGDEQRIFSEFGGGQNITLKVKITNAPPAIDIEATVRQWKDRGTWLLETDRGGIRTADDFKKAVKAFNEYVGKSEKPTWSPGTEKPEPLERYGNFGENKFVFQFFGDFEEETETIPDDCKIPNDYKDNFDVQLHGHTVYKVVGVDGSGEHNEELKNKMLK